MLIYYILLILCFVLSLDDDKKRQRPFYFALLILLIFIGAFRGLNVGADLSGSYLEKYFFINMNPMSWDAGSEMEPGFCFYLAYLKTHFGSYQLFYALSFAITMLCIHFLINRYSRNPVLSIFFLVLLHYYTWPFNAIRQGMAIGFVFLTIPLLEKQSLFRILIFEVLILLITFGWHRTCIVFTILPILFRRDFRVRFAKKRERIYFVLIVSYLIVLSSEFVHQFYAQFASSIQFLGERYSGYAYASADSEHTKSALSALLQTGIALYITYIVPKKVLSNPFYILYIAGMVISNVLGAYNALFLRVGTNLLYFSIILFANLWYNNHLKNLDLYKITVVLYGLILFSNTLLKNFGYYVPYTNWLL